MDQVLPWAELIELIVPHAPALMLFDLSDPSVGACIDDMPQHRGFVRYKSF